MNIAKDEVRGIWVATDMIDGHLVTRRYYGYTKAEAISAWNEEF